MVSRVTCVVWWRIASSCLFLSFPAPLSLSIAPAAPPGFFTIKEGNCAAALQISIALLAVADYTCRYSYCCLHPYAPTHALKHSSSVQQEGIYTFYKTGTSSSAAWSRNQVHSGGNIVLSGGPTQLIWLAGTLPHKRVVYFTACH